jgi:hypothetical protein
MRVADLWIEPAFGARDVKGRAARKERKRDDAGERQTEGGSERIFLHGAD